MSDVAPGPGTTMSRVRLPIDDVVDRVYASVRDDRCGASFALDLLAAQTEYVVRGVLAKHRAERGSA